MSSFKFRILIVSLFLMTIAASTLTKQVKKEERVQNPRTIAELKDSTGWVNTVFFLDLKGLFPLEGISANSGYLLYLGSWDYEVIYGSFHGQANLEKHFKDFDNDGIDEIVVKFNDEEYFSCDVIRVSLDNSNKFKYQLLQLPGVEWPMDAATLDFEPLSINNDNTLSWRTGPDSLVLVYQLVYQAENDSLALIKVSPK